MKADARRTVVVSRSLYTMIAAACRTGQRRKKAAAGRRHHPSVWLPVGIIIWVLLLGYLPGHFWP